MARQSVSPSPSGGCCSFSVSSGSRRGLRNRKWEEQLHRRGVEWRVRSELRLQHRLGEVGRKGDAYDLVDKTGRQIAVERLLAG